MLLDGTEMKPGRLLSSDVTHHAIDEFYEHRYVTDVMTIIPLLDEFPRVPLLPQHDVLVEILEYSPESPNVPVRRSLRHA